MIFVSSLSFAYSILAKLHWCDDHKSANRVSKYKEFRNELVNCHASMTLDDMDDFETGNKLAVNIYEIGEHERIKPLRVSSFANARETVDLLYLEEGDKHHYVLITDMEKLLKHVRKGYSTFVALPKHILDKKACVNIQCGDGKSFKWCILSAKYGSDADIENRCYVTKYFPYAAEFEGYDYPMKPDNIIHFERKERIAVNVYIITDSGAIEPLRISELPLNDPSVNLRVDLLLVKQHYVLIRNMSRLMRSQVTAHHGEHFVCRRCLHLCTSERVLQKHMERCVQHKAQAVKMPEPTEDNPDVTMRFKDIEKQLPLPFWFVADFESILKPIDTVLPDVPAPDQPERDEDGQLRFSKFRNVGSPDDGLRSTSSTTRIQDHEACGFAYQLMSVDPRFYEPPVVVRGKDCAREFISRLQADAERVRGWLKNPAPMQLSDEQQRTHDAATHCWICEEEFDWLDLECEQKHRDHDHVTGEYRGAAHARCNINYRINPDTVEVPCFLHNLKCYDAHLIIASTTEEHGPITAIPTNTEKYISFTIGEKLKKVQFKDSYAFMQASLDSLVNDLQQTELINTRRYLEMQEFNKRVDDDHFSVRSEDSSPDSDDEAFIDDSAMPELFGDDEDHGAAVSCRIIVNVVHSSLSKILKQFTRKRNEKQYFICYEMYMFKLYSSSYTN